MPLANDTETLVRHALAAVEHADAEIVAVATTKALQRLVAELEPLVGPDAVHALYRRSLHLTRASSDWAVPAGGLAGTEMSAGLHEQLVSRSAPDALAAGQGLLKAFANLLISLIGEPLTSRLVMSAWGEPSADALHKEKP